MGMLVIFAIALFVPSIWGARLPYIIGGTEVSDNTKWPWQGSLRYFSDHICGCALLSETWAVTAAHCVGSSAFTYTIRFGSTDRKRGGTLVTCKQIIMHEKYGSGSGSFPNDIAVMTFSTVSLNSAIRPITMATSNTALDSDCFITGWGFTQTGAVGHLSTILQEAHIKVYTQETCKLKWGGMINDGHVCIGDEALGRGSCNGDSGGPLVCKDGGEYQLVGVTSWGIEGCFTNYPSVYSRITHFRNWIKEKTDI